MQDKRGQLTHREEIELKKQLICFLVEAIDTLNCLPGSRERERAATKLQEVLIWLRQELEESAPKLD